MRLLKKRAKVVAAWRNQETLSSIHAETGVEHAVLDATSSEQVKQCFEHIVHRHGQIDGAVTCVGSILLKPAHLTSDEDWNFTITKTCIPRFMCYVLLHGA